MCEPKRCNNCYCETFEKTKSWSDERGEVEFILSCVDCGKFVGHWAYGDWIYNEESNMHKTKYITNLAILNSIFRFKVVPEVIEKDVKQRILDWLEDPRNPISDEYVIRQCAFVEQTLIANGHNLEDFFKLNQFPLAE